MWVGNRTGRRAARLMMSGIAGAVLVGGASPSYATGVDHVNFGGVSWDLNPAGKPAVSGSYTSVAANQVVGNNFFAARSSGGVDHIVFAGAPTNGWVINPAGAPAVTGNYVDLGSDGASETFYAAKASGGIDRIQYSGSGTTWLLNSGVGAPTSTGNYVSLASDLYQVNNFFAAKIGGGVDQYTNSGSGWVVNPNTAPSSSDVFVDLAPISSGEADGFWGALAGGGISKTFKTGANTWQSVIIPGTAGVLYSSIANNGVTNQNNFFAAHADGSGVDHVAFNGSAWLVNPAGKPSTLDFGDLAQNGSASNAFFGAEAVIPEPASGVGLIALGGLMVRRRRGN